VGPAHNLSRRVGGGDRRLGRGRVVATADRRCLGAFVEVGNFDLQHRRDEPGSLSEKVGRFPSSPLRSASISLQAARSKKRTGDPAEPWLIASSPRLYSAWAASHVGMSVGFSSCWASRHSRGGSGDGVQGVDVAPS